MISHFHLSSIHHLGDEDSLLDARLIDSLGILELVRYLEETLADGHRVDVLPGVADVVRSLQAREDTLVGPLTGNVERGAVAKLRHLDDTFGRAFGVRQEGLPRADAKLRHLGQTFETDLLSDLLR